MAGLSMRRVFDSDKEHTESGSMNGVLLCGLALQSVQRCRLMSAITFIDKGSVFFIKAHTFAGKEL